MPKQPQRKKQERKPEPVLDETLADTNFEIETWPGWKDDRLLAIQHEGWERLPNLTVRELRKPENWDFKRITRRGKYPPRFLKECFEYEIGRNSEYIFRNKTPEPSGEFKFLQGTGWDEPIIAPADYPMVPFEIACNGKACSQDEVGSDDKMTWLKADEALKLLQETQNDIKDDDEYVARWGKEDCDNLTIGYAQWRWDSLVLFEIPNDAPITRLMEQFEEFLHARFGRDHSPGKNSGDDWHKHYRSLLHKLGAWRLLKSGFTVKQAMIYSQDYSADKAAIYSNAAEWSKAIKVIDSKLLTLSRDGPF